MHLFSLSHFTFSPPSLSQAALAASEERARALELALAAARRLVASALGDLAAAKVDAGAVSRALALPVKLPTVPAPARPPLAVGPCVGLCVIRLTYPLDYHVC